MLWIKTIITIAATLFDRQFALYSPHLANVNFRVSTTSPLRTCAK